MLPRRYFTFLSFEAVPRKVWMQSPLKSCKPFSHRNTLSHSAGDNFFSFHFSSSSLSVHVSRQSLKNHSLLYLYFSSASECVFLHVQLFVSICKSLGKQRNQMERLSRSSVFRVNLFIAMGTELRPERAPQPKKKKMKRAARLMNLFKCLPINIFVTSSNSSWPTLSIVAGV